MKVQLNTPINEGSERRGIPRGENTISRRMRNTNTVGAQRQSAYKVDDSVLEINEIRKTLYCQLTSGDKTKTLEQLHSEICENYAGGKYEKYIAALILVQQDLADLNALNRSNAPSPEPSDAWRKGIPPSEFDLWSDSSAERRARYFHYLNPYTHNAIESNQHGNGLILEFSGRISREFWNNGIESGLAMFERIHTNLTTRFQGSEEELKARLEALERGFLKAVDSFAETSAAILMIASYHYTPLSNDFELTAKQAAANDRIAREAARLTEHIQNMFRAALALFRATGSFAGALDSLESNQAGMMSLRDVEIAPRAVLGRAGHDPMTHRNVSDISGLSSSGRAFLQRFYMLS